jgi:L-histidine N-alpha-methyltransferase
MTRGDRLLLGMDMVKEESILNDAYNDNFGVTAAFNKNILNVVNSIIKSDFKQDDFDHLAFYNKEKSRIEMHLVANTDISISSIFLEDRIIIRKGESIHTENSHKYNTKDIEEFARASLMQIKKIHRDQNRWFSLVEFIK